MRQRSYPVQIYLDEKEYAALCGNAKKSGLSKSSYIRSLLAGYSPKELPRMDFFALMRELHAIGNLLNQIAVRVHSTGHINAMEYADNSAELSEITQRIYEAVMLPEKMEKKAII